MIKYWMIMLENSIMAICWTFLAYHFNKWWIALFMVLCFTSITTKAGGNK
jgi:predicted secreted protein